MKELIYRFVQKFGVNVLLSNKVYNGLLDYYFIDWADAVGNYYSLFVPCNETQAFTHNLGMIGVGGTNVSLSANLRVFQSKVDWVSGRWGKKDIKQFNERLKDAMGSIPCVGVSYGGFHLDHILYAWRPAIQIVFSYSFQDDYAGCLSIAWGQESFIRAQDDAHKCFLTDVLETYGLSKMCHFV